MSIELQKVSKFSEYSDAELINLLRKGDADALTEIHTRYYLFLYNHAYRRFPYQEDVRDILQELFTFLWDNRLTLQFNNSLTAYLYTSVHNRILNIHRHYKIRGSYAESLQEFLEKGEYTTDETVREKELLKLIETEIAALPPQMRAIFEMSRNQNLSHNEIAEKLNLSPHTVRTQVRNALRILRIKLGASVFLIFF